MHSFYFSCRSFSGADIDSLCAAPRHVDRSDFFSSFYELLRQVFLFFGAPFVSSDGGHCLLLCRLVVFFARGHTEGDLVETKVKLFTLFNFV